MITIEDYNEKCIAVFGDFTTDILTRLKALNGLENTKLKSPDSDIKRTGWVFPKSKRTVLETQLAKYMNTSQSAAPVQQPMESGLALPPSGQENKDVYTKKEVNAIIAKLLARIESLEAEIGYTKSITKTQPSTQPAKAVLPKPPAKFITKPAVKHTPEPEDDDCQEEDSTPLFKQIL
jgi:hypothetical protein